MPLLGFLPVNSRIPTGSLGATAVGAATILAALQDISDANYVHVGTTPDFANHTFITSHTVSSLPAGAHINSISVYYRTRFLTAAGWIYPGQITGLIGSERHSRTLAAYAPGSGSTSPQLITTSWSSSAADGTPWSSCDRWEIEWYYHSSEALSPGGWTASTFPYITYSYMAVNYTPRPSVGAITPLGTITIPQPTLEWSVDQGPQTAFQVVIVPPGSTDAAGVVVPNSGFDPETGSGVVYNSGKIYSGSSTHFLPVSLTNGAWFPYIRAWTGSGATERVTAWANVTFTVAVDTVDQPTVSLTDDTATNTLQVTIAAGSHTATQVADAIEVQYLDPVGGWVAAPIAGGRVGGTGTSVFYDGLQAPGATASYRARGLYRRPSDGLVVVSAWATGTHVVADPHQWWLRSTTSYTLNRSLNDTSTLLIKSWKPQRARPQAATWGVGARAATVVHDITKGDVHQMSVWAFTKAAYDSLLALIQGDDDLLLVNEWGETWRVQVGERIDEEIVRASPRSGESTPLGHVRVVSFTLIEVVVP